MNEQLYDVYEARADGDVCIARNLTEKAALELANEYGTFGNGDPCAWIEKCAESDGAK